jgi:hypothetical protein
MAHWETLLNEGDFPGARASCLQEFEGLASAFEACMGIAEVEERWGDSLFFAGEAGAAAHYLAAGKQLSPPGLQITSKQENDLRMNAYQRVMNKLRAIDPCGKARPGHDGQPHPNWCLNQRPRVPAVPEQHPREIQIGSTCPKQETDLRMGAHQGIVNEPQATDPYGEAQLGHDGQSHPDSFCGWQPPEPLAPAPYVPEIQSSGACPRQESEYARLFQDRDHWCYYELGAKWRDAGNALAVMHPEVAHRAYSWSLYFLGLYEEAWTRHLPASRWDSDGRAEMTAVRNLADSLPSRSSEVLLPAWVEAFLQGDWQCASAGAGESPTPPEWSSLSVLLAEARLAAGGQCTKDRIS